MSYNIDLEEENVKLRETVVELTSDNEQYLIEIKSLKQENLNYYNHIQEQMQNYDELMNDRNRLADEVKESSKTIENIMSEIVQRANKEVTVYYDIYHVINTLYNEDEYNEAIEQAISEQNI